MPHPAFLTGSVPVITGGASGIGLAAAKRFARLGLKVCIADFGADRLTSAAKEISAPTAGGASDVLPLKTDVSRIEDLWRKCGPLYAAP